MDVPLHRYWEDMSPLSHRDRRPWVHVFVCCLLNSSVKVHSHCTTLQCAAPHQQRIRRECIDVRRRAHGAARHSTVCRVGVDPSAVWTGQGTGVRDSEIRLLGSSIFFPQQSVSGIRNDEADNSVQENSLTWTHWLPLPRDMWAVKLYSDNLPSSRGCRLAQVDLHIDC